MRRSRAIRTASAGRTHWRVFGSGRRRPRLIHLQAGPLTMFFERDGAFLRRICLRGIEVVRGIYAAVRDRNWGTVPARLSRVRVRRASGGFRLAFSAVCRQAGVVFRWRGEIIGTPDGAVRYTFDGEAGSSFLRNRIGFCVLHPLEACAGRPCEVEHTDGTRARGVFPRRVSPHQPFTRLRALTYEAAPGAAIETRCEGDVFEMEDQRNWTDASFKTYCTPLELPFPVLIEKGARVRQSVTVRVKPPARGRRVSAARAITARRGPLRIELVVPRRATRAMPPIGLGMASHGRPLGSGELERLRRLAPAHLRADLELSRPGWRAVLQRAAQEARRLDCGAHLALFVTDAAAEELRALRRELDLVRPPVALWLVYHVREPAAAERWVRSARAALADFDPSVSFAAGANANLAELNRHRPARASHAFPCFSINPQVHAFDDLSLVENLEAQGQAVATAAAFSPHPVVVSPITLKPRFNPVATGRERPPAPGELPAQVDPRQMSLFGAAWTLGSIAALAATGRVHSLTYYETTGWRGVMETAAGSPLPRRFRSTPGAVFPVFFVFAALAGFTRMAPIVPSVPGAAAALALFAPGRRRLLVANLTGDFLEARVRAAAQYIRRRLLEPANVATVVRAPDSFLESRGIACKAAGGRVHLDLAPHALAWLDLEG